MLRWIETEHLIGLRNPQSDDQIDDLEQHEGADPGERQGRRDRHDLLAELAGFAEDQPVRAGAVDRELGEEAGRQSAPDAADAVDREDVERVIDAESLLEQLEREEAEDARRRIRSRSPTPG